MELLHPLVFMHNSAVDDEDGGVVVDWRGPLFLNMLLYGFMALGLGKASNTSTDSSLLRIKALSMLEIASYTILAIFSIFLAMALKSLRL